MKRKVYTVYEPPNGQSRVPMPIQTAAGFSHAKLVVLTRGDIDSGQGKVYHIWKDEDGGKSIGYLNDKQEGDKWPGLAPGEHPELVCTTTFTNDQIIAEGMPAFVVRGTTQDADWQKSEPSHPENGQLQSTLVKLRGLRVAVVKGDIRRQHAP
ncbi:hypothetical protein PG985_014722 [Apiospora marii]|uniref:Uncharacterized protein n=1 Tax=Apiospora marii TaxID=335849 RepID=A0ABR1R4G7_9PEZI